MVDSSDRLVLSLSLEDCLNKIVPEEVVVAVLAKFGSEFSLLSTGIRKSNL